MFPFSRKSIPCAENRQHSKSAAKWSCRLVQVEKAYAPERQYRQDGIAGDIVVKSRRCEEIICTLCLCGKSNGQNYNKN